MNAIGNLTLNVVGLYVRLSEEDRNKLNEGDDSESIRNQKLLLTEYAIEQGWQIYRIYCDDDWSGLDSKRPQFNQLIKDCEDGKINIVLCKTQSRFTRDAELVEKYIHNKFLEWGIRFVSILDHSDTNVKGNKKARQINGLINEWYCEDLSENIREVFQAKMRNGEYIASFAPYGYIKEGKEIVVDEYAANVVRRIFKLYLEGNGTHRIAQMLYEEGYEKPSVYKQKIQKLKWHSPNCTDKELWGHTTINRILRNEFYIGTMIQSKETTVSYKNKKRIQKKRDEWIVFEDYHEPIITKETFYAVQKLLDAKRQSKKRKGVSHMLAGKIHCANCGATMLLNGSYKRTEYGSQLVHQIFKCKNYCLSRGKLCEYSNKIYYDEVCDAVNNELISIVSAFLEDSKNKAKVMSYLQETQEENDLLSGYERESNTLKRKIDERVNAMSQLYLDKVSNTLSEAQYNLLFSRFQDEICVMQQKLESVTNKIREQSVQKENRFNVTELVNNFKNYGKLNHEVCSKYIDDILIGTDENGNRTIEVKWNISE